MERLLRHFKNETSHEFEVLKVWDRFLNKFDEQLFIILTLHRLEHDNYSAVIKIKNGLDITFNVLKKSLSDKNDLLFVHEEYKKVNEIYNLLQDYSPKGSHELLISLRRRLTQLRKLRG